MRQEPTPEPLPAALPVQSIPPKVLKLLRRGLSYRAIVATLNEKRVPTKRRRWHAATVRGVVQRRGWYRDVLGPTLAAVRWALSGGGVSIGRSVIAPRDFLVFPAVQASLRRYRR